MTDVLLYARLSVIKDESVSIDRQLKAGRNLAKARGWNVVGEFTDDGVSATKNKPEDRIGWRHVLDAARTRAAHGEPVHAVIVWKVDRLARRVLDFLNADNALREHGAGIVAVEDPIDMTTPQGRAFATVLAVFAELEAAAIAARVKDARHALLRAGRRAGGRPPYGFRNIDNPEPGGNGKVLAHDPETIGYVREAADRALRGDSLYSITRWLDGSGAPRRTRNHKGKPRNGHWAEASVEAILRNPALAGLVPFSPNRKPGEEPDPWAVLRDDDGVPVVDESVAILTITERHRLLEALDAAKRPGSRPQQRLGEDGQPQATALLSRLLRCGSCGSTLHRSRAAGKYLVFRCANRECPARVSVSEPAVESHVIATVLAERGETRVHEFRTVGADTQTLAAIEEALRTAGAELATSDAGPGEEEYDRLLARIARLKARRAEARRESMPTTKPLVAPTRGQREWGDEFQSALDAHDVREAARLLREQVTSITVLSAGRNAHVPVADRIDITYTPLADDAA